MAALGSVTMLPSSVSPALSRLRNVPSIRIRAPFRSRDRPREYRLRTDWTGRGRAGTFERERRTAEIAYAQQFGGSLALPRF